MKIGFDASRAFVSEPGGTENYSLQLLKAMLAVGGAHEYCVYTRGDASLQGESLEGQNRVHVRQIHWPRFWTQGGLALATWSDPLDVLFVPAHTLPVLRKPGLPTVVTIHGLEYEYLPEHYRFPQKLFLTGSTRYAVRHATRIIAVSQFTAFELVRRLNADPNTISVIQEGVDWRRFGKTYSEKEKTQTLKDLGIHKPYVLFVGVIQPRKNLERLIEAFSFLPGMIPAGPEALWAGAPVKLTLVIAGKLGWMYERILSAPEKFGVSGQVKFVGYVPARELPILMQEAEVYVQPSLTEGFGLPVLEAMAAGTPVVAARAGALSEIAGNAALLVDPRDTGEIARGITKVLSEKGLGRLMRERGLSWSRSFSWERTATETLAVLAEASAMRIE